MNILSLCGICLVALMVSANLKKSLPAYHLILITCMGIIISIYILNASSPIFAKINSLFAYSKIDPKYSSAMLKSFGICFVAQFASDFCEDSGESALAHKIEFAGKIAIAITAFPIFEEIVNLSSTLIGAI